LDLWFTNGSDDKWGYIEHEFYSGKEFIARGIWRIAVVGSKHVKGIIPTKEWMTYLFGQQVYENLLEQGRVNEKVKSFVSHDLTLKEKEHKNWDYLQCNLCSGQCAFWQSREQ
jgi:hypothetical protein